MAHRLAGLVLVVDGLLVALLGMVAIVVFQPIAAVEGRPSVDQTPYPLLILPLVLGLAFVWAGQRALRGIRRGRRAGIVLGTVLAVGFGALAVGSGSGLESRAIIAGLALLQVLTVVALARWPALGQDRQAGALHA